MRPGWTGQLMGVLILGTALSGCVGSDGSASAPGGSLQGVADAAFEGGGTILGLVTDQELNPIGGALVAVGEAVTVMTGPDGTFRATNVPPGEVRVVVQALGFQSVARHVVVEPEDTVEVSFTLEKLPVTEPYHDYFILVGFACLQTYTFGIRLTYGNFVCPEAPAGVVVQFEATKGVVTIVSAMAWEQTSALSAYVLGLDLWQGGVRTGVWTCDYCYGTAEGPSPVVLRVDGAFEGINGKEAEETSVIDNIVILRGDPRFAGQVGLIYSQRVDIYTSVFYQGKAPEGYTGLPDS